MLLDGPDAPAGKPDKDALATVGQIGVSRDQIEHGAVLASAVAAPVGLHMGVGKARMPRHHGKCRDR